MLYHDRCMEMIEKAVSDGENKNINANGVGLGVLDIGFMDRLYEAIQKAIEPYGRKSNRFSRTHSLPNIILPGDIIYRYRTLVNSKSTKSIERPKYTENDCEKLIHFSQTIKQYAKEILSHCIDKIEDEQNIDTTNTESDEGYPSCIHDEEQGYLVVHVIVVPKREVYRPLHLFSSTGLSGKRRRKRFHNNNFDTQGGDPRSNLEHRINQTYSDNDKSSSVVWTINQAVEFFSSNKDNNITDITNDDRDRLENETLPENPLDIHVAVWRRPFYIRSMYTKTRRDVSQTPFFVVNGGKRQRLGITSVEEVLSSVIVPCCGGISTVNNNPFVANVMYGMAKFHASGREDMDVRMLLPSKIFTATAANQQQSFQTKDGDSPTPKKQVVITGRPFVYEIVDALRLPHVNALQKIVDGINNCTITLPGVENSMPTSGLDNDRTNLSSCEDPINSYGNNNSKYGVGISSMINFVPASSFKKLQAETEDKVKYYGCLCWCENVLPQTDDELMLMLGTFPLQIEQLTPIRVLHRRAHMKRIRHILTCSANVINEHYFRLHISTDAGTYVKEFVHSDLGRTVPSISSLLNSRTDIFELDCEGIQM